MNTYTEILREHIVNDSLQHHAFAFMAFNLVRCGKDNIDAWELSLADYIRNTIAIKEQLCLLHEPFRSLLRETDKYINYIALAREFIDQALDERGPLKEVEQLDLKGLTVVGGAPDVDSDIEDKDSAAVKTRNLIKK